MKKLKYIYFISLVSFLGISSIHAKECAVCGPDSLPIPIGIPNFVSKLILLAQIATPVIIIIMALVKYFKAVTSGDEKVIKETNSSFIRSLITGVSIFLVVTIVKFAFSLLGTEYSSYLHCVSCFLNGDGDCNVKVCPDRGSLESSSYFCFQCSTNSFDKVWSDQTPEASNSCKDGYVLVDLNESACKSSCYECDNDPTRHVWVTSNPGKTDACPGGYHSVYLTESECINYTYSCYQCNHDGTIYKWGTNNDKDANCSSYYRLRNDLTEEECHN